MINVQLTETVVAALSARAATQGLTLNAYLENVLLSAPTQPAPRLSLEELDRLLDQEATTGFSPYGSFSRAEL
jgi:hypothetical protein